MANDHMWRILEQGAWKNETAKRAYQRLSKLQGHIDDLAQNGGKRKRIAFDDVKTELEAIRGEIRSTARTELEAWKQTAAISQVNLEKERRKNATTQEYVRDRWKSQAERMSDHELKLFAAGYAGDKNLKGGDPNCEYDKLNIYGAELRRRGLNEEADHMSQAMEKNEAASDWIHTTGEGREARRQMKPLQDAVQDAGLRVWYKEGENDKEVPVGVQIEELIDTSPLNTLPD